MEGCFTASARPLASARGMYRFSFVGAVFSLVLSLLSLESIVSCFFVFSLVAVWFFLVGIWQLRQARRLALSILMVDDDGIVASISGDEHFFPASSVCAAHGSIARSAGIGRQYRVCRAVMLCNSVIIADIDTAARVRLQTSAVFSGETMPLDGEEYERLLGILKDRGWDRPCTEASAPPERRRFPVLRAAWAGGVVLCLLGWILLEIPRLSMAFLLGGLGLAGLLLNSLYSRKGTSQAD